MLSVVLFGYLIPLANGGNFVLAGCMYNILAAISMCNMFFSASHYVFLWFPLQTNNVIQKYVFRPFKY